MRASFFFIGATAAALVGAAVMGAGCSSSNNSSNNNTADGGGTDASCAYTQNLATTQFDPLVTCFQQYCGPELQACSTDCDCNTATTKSVQCFEADGGEIPCFVTQPYAVDKIAPTNTPAKNLIMCLEMYLESCGLGGDGGTDGGGTATPEGGSDAGLDAGAQPDADAGAANEPDADAGSSPDADASGP